MREALKLTLAALKQIDEAMPFPVAKLAIMEAEKALAQPEQKPVAWFTATPIEGNGNRVLYEQVSKQYNGTPDTIPLYTTPPQRTWVGLTDDERTDIRSKVGEYTDFKRWDYTKRVQEATELALKEKNA